MKEVGNRMQFWQVAMRPGKPLAFGAMNGHSALRTAGQSRLFHGFL